MAEWLETDSAANVDISSATKIGEYVATADRFVMAQVFVDQVAGNGDYELYATLKIGGSGSAYRFIPITSAKAASGVTAIAAVSGWIPVRSGDVVAIYIDGLAGDNTTPDVVVRWFAQQLAADVSGLATSAALSTLDGKVATASALSTLDGKIDALPTPLNAAGIRGAVGLASANLDAQLGAIPTGAPLDAAGIRAAVGLALANLDSQLAAIPTAAPLDAAGTRAAVGLNTANLDTQLSLLATAAALSTVDGNILALPGVADIADGLWDELLAGHAIAGSAGEALAQAASGSGGGGGGGLTKADVRDALGMAAANLDNQLNGLSNAIGAVGDQLDSVPYCTPGNPVTGGPGDMPRIDLRGVQGDTTQWAITGLDLTGATNVWITAKDALWKDDAHAVFQVSDDAGLAVLAEQVAAHPEWGVLTIIDADSIAVMLDENATRVVTGNVKLSLDIQKQTAGGIKTIAIGTVEFRKDVTWTTI